MLGSPCEHAFVPQVLCQREHAGHFMPVGYAGAANTSTSALNVVQNIPQVNVRSPQSTNNPILVNPDSQLTLKLLGSQPVTPVKVDRFEHLLDGYSPALKQYLVDGFRFGFRIYFIGELSQFESPNLKSPPLVVCLVVAGRLV